MDGVADGVEVILGVGVLLAPTGNVGGGMVEELGDGVGCGVKDGVGEGGVALSTDFSNDTL